MPLIQGVSDKNVKDFAYSLMKEAGAKEFPKFTPKPNFGENAKIAVYQNSDTGVSVEIIGK